MRKWNTQKRRRSYLVAVALLLLSVICAQVGGVAAKYVKEVKLPTPIVLPKNYYTVTYYQYDGQVMVESKEFNNTSHALRDDTGVVTPSGSGDFQGWVTVTGTTPLLETVGGVRYLKNRESIALFPSFAGQELTTYTVSFMDMKGETMLGRTTFSSAQVGLSAMSVITEFPTAPDLTAEDLEFKGWSIRSTGGETQITFLENYTLPSSNVIVYATYAYSGLLALVAVDEDGDGNIDYYQVEAVANLPAYIIIPGMVNGIPVKVINKIYDGSQGKADYDVTKITIEEGVEILGSNAFGGTPNLEEVELPHSLKEISSNAFSTQGEKKAITIYYAGTIAEWNLIEKQTGGGQTWDKFIVDGSTLVCTDGTLVKNGKQWKAA